MRLLDLLLGALSTKSEVRGMKKDNKDFKSMRLDFFTSPLRPGSRLGLHSDSNLTRLESRHSCSKCHINGDILGVGGGKLG